MYIIYAQIILRTPGIHDNTLAVKIQSNTMVTVYLFMIIK